MIHVKETANNRYSFSFRLSDEAGLAVNFNIHMDPAKGETSATEITEILTQEILSSNITGKIKFYYIQYQILVVMNQISLNSI